MRLVFERVVAQCLAFGIAEVHHVAVDGTHVNADASKDKFVDRADELPRDGASRAVRDYFTDLDEAVPDLPGTTRHPPKAISRTDPGAALSTKHGRRTFAYGMNAMIDTASGIVLDVEAAPARFADEPEAARRTVERTKERHGRVPDVLAADTAYGSGHFLSWAEGHGIEPHALLASVREDQALVPPPSAFAYDEKRDLYICPQGKLLVRSAASRRTGREAWSNGLAVLYRARKRDCAACVMREGCCPKTNPRRIKRSVFEPAKDRARARLDTSAFKRSHRLRLRIERLFACIKHNDGLTRVRLRGRRGADEQFTLAATARNLKTMAKLLSGPAPPPAGA